ncbi:MAG: 23S rRNA (adenine(2503)-C(2))-methyltransferase RlmN [Candidatus Cloacimonetes bacterium]|nr:23S rRNA (adenine(2503)-C(2))-methyltransferase RlmN [Candidatus Cloacimonadota bacterium]
MAKQTHLLDLLPEQLEEQLMLWQEPRYRVKQILDWYYRHHESNLDRMSSLPLALREKLKTLIILSLPPILDKLQSRDGSIKYLLSLDDSARVEMVTIPTARKNTLCVSSQVGCARQCTFCATAGMGLQRNLLAREILAQILLAQQQLDPANLTNIVFMGMGEPLDNLDQVLDAIKALQSSQRFNFSPRRITLSTCGIIPGIVRLASAGIKLKLAVSLNSAIQTKREQLMPIAGMYPLSELKPALLDFRRNNPYRITFEYIMIRNFNTGKEDAEALRSFLGDISCKLNLIPWNQIGSSVWQEPSAEEVESFQNELNRIMPCAVTLRHSRGADIAAACGQLAGKAS